MPIKKNRKFYKDDNCSPGDIPKDVVDDINTYFTDIYLKRTNFEQDILETKNFYQHENEDQRIIHILLCIGQ